ncbi:MAG: AAA family ATPase [Nitrososphaeraceae archaeon]
MTLKIEDLSSENTEIELISTSEALRETFGTYEVQGIIMGISKIFNMISKVIFYCDECSKLNELTFPYPESRISYSDKRCKTCNKFIKNDPNPDFKKAVIVELQDTETFNDIDILPVFLFDKNTVGIRVGETVIVKGDIRILKNNKKRYFTYLYAKSIQYLNREDLTLTKLDVEANKRFVSLKGQNNVIDELVSLFDPSIVGYEQVKKGLLYSAVNTSNEISNKSQRLHGVLIGDPGLAKTQLLKRATELVPGSSKESAQHSSGRTLTAIVDKSDDNTFLRLGAIPMARGAICGLNELSRMHFEDQAQLLDVMEEGEFTINKHGIHARIRSPTTILASANPINKSKWKDSDKVDLNEFPILEPIIDRCDLIFVFKSRKTKEEIDEFADKLSKVEDKKDKGKIPDYTIFLMKYIRYAKQFNPILKEEARIMLTEFYKEISIRDFGSPRILITLFKLAKAISRLKLKNIVDENDAKETMDFYNVMLLDFQKSVVLSQSPKEIAYNECISLLVEIKNIGGITFEELIEKVCKKNGQIANYLGYNNNKQLRIRNNKKVRNIYEMLLNHTNIKLMQEKPVVLQWRCDPCDPCDPTKKEKKLNSDTFSGSEDKIEPNNDYNKSRIYEGNNEITPNNTNDNQYDKSKELENNHKTNSKATAHGSHRSHDETRLWKCYYCPIEFNTREKYEKHYINNHPGMPVRPYQKWIKTMKEDGVNRV